MNYDDQGTGIDYAALIHRTLLDTDAMAAYENLWFHNAPTIFDDRSRIDAKIRGSDAGRCAQELWADIHHKFDLPEDPHALDDRMHQGITDGARHAYLIAAGIRRWHWPLTITIEQIINNNDIPGHADGVVWAEPDPIEVFENKWTRYTGPIEDPSIRNAYWCHQAANYALGIGAPYFVLIVHAPAAYRRPTCRSFRYATVEWAVKTGAEYARLRTAEADEPPPPDAPEDQPWRCESCRWSQCTEGRNINPRRPMVEVFVDEIGVLD